MSLRARLLAAFAYTLLIVIVALEVPLAANLSDRVNAEGVRRFLDAPADDVRSRFEDLHRRVVISVEATSDETWTSAYPYYPDDDTLGERIGSLLGSDDGRFTHASAHLPDLRAYVDATRR